MRTSLTIVTEQVGQKRQVGGPPVLYFFNSITQFDNPAQVETISAHIVQAQHGAPNFYALIDKCDVMVTSELSGCCLILDRSVPPPRSHTCGRTARSANVARAELHRKRASRCRIDCSARIRTPGCMARKTTSRFMPTFLASPAVVTGASSHKNARMVGRSRVRSRY